MTSLQHARTAAAWMNQHLHIFTGTVTEPHILRRNDADILRQISQQIAFGATYDDIRDNLLFDFENVDDLRLFLTLVREDMNCAVHVCLQGAEYIINHTEI
jgi:hypothetical protein